MRPSFATALLAADRVRTDHGVDMFDPINVFDICEKLDVTVRFVDINMEGMYISQDSGKHSTIILSHMRPMPRRNFTCAHELGHHVFKHGTRVDGLVDQPGETTSNDEEETLVNNFAAALLMPVAGITSAFRQRDKTAEKGTVIDFYKVSSTFGTGYQTLVTHCKANNLITQRKEAELLKQTPAKILKTVMGIGNPNSHFKMFDDLCAVSTIDVEVSNYVILPLSAIIEGDHLKKLKSTSFGNAYEAVKSGVLRVSDPKSEFNCFVRVQNTHYVGLAVYRHLEIKD